MEHGARRAGLGLAQVLEEEGSPSRDLPPSPRSFQLSLTLFHQLDRPELLLSEQLTLINRQLEVFYCILVNQGGQEHWGHCADAAATQKTIALG